MKSRVRDNENIRTRKLRMELANNEEMPMLPHSWQRLIRKHDVASHEPRFSLSILNMALPAIPTARSLELEVTVTPDFSNLSQDLTYRPYMHPRVKYLRSKKLVK